MHPSKTTDQSTRGVQREAGPNASSMELRRNPRLVGPAHRIQSVDRAAALMRAIASAPRPPTVAELAGALGINRSTAWRLLGTLEYNHLVDRDSFSQGYILGAEFANLGSGVLHDSVVRLARPVLTSYADRLGETLTLAVPNALGVVYVDQVDPPGAARASWVGQAPALHATSTGKVFLAWLPRSELEVFLQPPLAKYTAQTITDPKELLADLSSTIERGFGICDREYEDYSRGAAAPVMSHAGRPFAIVATWGLTRGGQAPASLEEEGASVKAIADLIQNGVLTARSSGVMNR